ncbi:hypothetical protein KFJ24_11395 [Marinobacter sediminum]|uniref:DUF5666 domain-containing protein n=1 Tax=Marinobacter sediminum TaxID=256323 RepID=UPI00202F1B61|nr:DUF5666 domain-containing protein [Marinobacter sediminum]MCM0613076.1 hypothetical protein [Marinobacter sediminum]
MKRQFRNRVFGLATGTVAFGVISACGGAGGGGLDVADGGIRGTGSSVGPVSGFGSVFVNGVEFSTDGIPNRAVESNDGITTESALSEGMILRVTGEWRDDGLGTADELSYDDTLRGPIDQLTPDPSGAGEFVTVTVMGQVVRVDRQTVVRGTTFAGLLSGIPISDHVRISAWRQADGSYRAGYLGTIPPDLTDVELEGTVSAVDTELNQFTIGTITVEYDEDNVSFGSGLAEADLDSVTALEVEGSLAGTVLTAVSIDRDDARRFSRDNAEDVEYTATIDSPYTASGTGTLPGEFTIGNLTVRVTDTTELEDNLTLSDLTEGLLVQVEGRFLSDTVVEAEEIELRDGNAKVKGVISSAADNTFIVGGVEVRVTPASTIRIEDGPGISFSELPQELRVVEVEGIETVQDSQVFIEALKVEVDDENADQDELSQYELEGRLRDISPTSISVLGIVVDAGPASFKDDSQTEIIDLFDQGETPVLEVNYEGTAPNFTAAEIELESRDDD